MVCFSASLLREIAPPPPLASFTSSLHHLVELALDVELGVFGLHTFQLDGHLFTRGNVGT